MMIKKDDHGLSFQYSTDGDTWTKFKWGASASTEAVQRIARYAAGKGEAALWDFRHRPLARTP